MEYKYVGNNIHRLKKEEYYKKELEIVEEFNKFCRFSPNMLRDIIYGHKDIYPTVEEEKAAMSMLQWLGTPVGQGFLEKIKK